MAVDPKFTKAVDSFMVLQSEKNTLKYLFSGIDDDASVVKDLAWTLCDRDDISSKNGNYFKSFNLPTEAHRLSTASTVSRLFPELQQLNVDRIVIAQIPSSYYSEFIDGRTIKVSVPQSGGTGPSSFSAITLISSTYTGDVPLKSESNPLLGDNIVFLFSDTINKPYTGNTIDEQGQVVSHSANTSWDPTGDYIDRPSAVMYREVYDNRLSLGGANFKPLALTPAYNTDKRTNPNYAVPVSSDYPDGRVGYNYDIPCGFAVLDKGFIVITHTAITSNIPWTSGFTQGTNAAYVDGNPKTDVYFTGTTDGVLEAAYVTYKDVDTSFKMAAVCLAMPREFYISNNSTWDRTKVIDSLNEQNGFINFDSVYVTEVGMYNALGELVAVSKLSEPVEKNYTNVITFNVDIEM